MCTTRISMLVWGSKPKQHAFIHKKERGGTIPIAIAQHQGGEKWHKSKYFREILPNLAPGHLCTLGRLAVPKIIYVRPVGSPENT